MSHHSPGWQRLWYLLFTILTSLLLTQQSVYQHCRAASVIPFKNQTSIVPPTLANLALRSTAFASSVATDNKKFSFGESRANHGSTSVSQNSYSSAEEKEVPAFYVTVPNNCLKELQSKTGTSFGERKIEKSLKKRLGNHDIYRIAYTKYRSRKRNYLDVENNRNSRIGIESFISVEREDDRPAGYFSLTEPRLQTSMSNDLLIPKGLNILISKRNTVNKTLDKEKEARIFKLRSAYINNSKSRSIVRINCTRASTSHKRTISGQNRKKYPKRKLLSVNVSFEDLEELEKEESVVRDEMDNFNDTSSNRTSNCIEWKGGQNTLFQVGNLLYLVAFIIPHNFRASALLMRCCLTVAVTLFTGWAGMYLCALDVFLWCLLLLLINLIHTLRLGYVLWPARISPEMLDFYNKLFRPLKVARVPFSQLVRDAKIEYLRSGHIYAEEDLTAAGAHLTVLLTGRMSVSCDSTHLHYIFPNQFVDSIEWENSEGQDEPKDLFQVTVISDEDCMLLVWQRRKLLSLFQEKHCLRAVMHNLIGKDITTKLYSLTEQIQPQSLGSSLSGVSSAPILLPGDRTGPARSISADAVHTGNRGLVRSSVWRASHRRIAARGGSPNLQTHVTNNNNNRYSDEGISHQYDSARESLGSGSSANTTPAMIHKTLSPFVPQTPQGRRLSGQQLIDDRLNVLEESEAESDSQNFVSGSRQTAVIFGANADYEDRLRVGRDDSLIGKSKRAEDPTNSNIVYVSERRERSPCKELPKRSSVVRLVHDTAGTEVSEASRLHSPVSIAHDERCDASTQNLLDDPSLMETAV